MEYRSLYGERLAIISGNTGSQQQLCDAIAASYSLLLAEFRQREVVAGRTYRSGS